MSADWQEDIDDLMTAYGQLARAVPDDPPISADEIKLRAELVREEAAELVEALEGGDLAGAAKEIIDVLVVTIGAGSSLGLDLGPLWDAVHASNMAKTGGPKDPETGKQLKPEGWEPPDIEGELRNQGWLK